MDLSADSMEYVTIRRVGTATEADEETEILIVGLAEEEDGTGWTLLFMNSDSYDEEDRRLGMDRYCLSNEGGHTVYGGLRRCELRDHVLLLEFEADGRDILGVGAVCYLDLQVDHDAIGQLRQDLRRIFSTGSERPARLVL